MADPKDDLEAVREIAATLEAFSGPERERILRWVREKLDMPAVGTPVTPPTQGATPPPAPPPASIQLGQADIRTFIAAKSPKNDVQLAAVVAYYHQFVAPEDQRKDSIVSADLTEACRQADRTRPSSPAQTLINAFNDGLLDRAQHGHYRLNSVGENLVAMVLPGDEGEAVGRRTINKRRGTKRKVKKKTKKKTKKRSKKKKAKKKVKTDRKKTA